MITFTQAPTVAPGDPITSTQLAKLAAAFNGRLRSGLGDPTWRIVFYFLSMFRQVRNSDGGFLFPAMAEFFTGGYQMLQPSEGEWPATEPGEPEGANVASQIMAYVFGAEAIDLWSEDLRLTDPDAGGIPLWIGGHSPETPQEFWDLAKLQRGAVDPDSGALGSPAHTAARSHYAIASSPRSMHGHAYGGYLPTADVNPFGCDDPNDTDDYPAPVNYVIKFQALTEGLSDITYDGTCQPVPGGEGYPTHVAWISYTPQAYFVFLNDGSVDVLPTADYLEGPYTGEARLRKTANNAIGRVMNAFAGEFRGSDNQRSTVANYHLQEAFDTQRFLTSQYHLAPNRGTESGGLITVEYPLFRFAGSLELAAGTFATHTQSSTESHAYHENCVLTGYLATGSKLAGPVTVELLNDADVISTVTLTPDELGDAAELVLLVTPLTPDPLKCRLTTACTFTDAEGKIEIETTELLSSKPTIEDLFLVLRTAGAIESDVMDGRGIDEDSAREISEEYFSQGCVTNHRFYQGLPGSLAAVNSNAVYDVARRLSQWVRIMPRQQIVGYAVEGGKSVVWFNRFASLGGVQIDMCEGIAPPRGQVLSGDLLAERTYIVRVAAVTYLGDEYAPGETFTAVAGASTFTTVTGQVFEYNGIRHAAYAQGETNEWLMGVQFKGYHPSESSLWKPDAYSDYFALSNRCHFYAPEVGNDAPLLWHTAYGQRVSGTFGGVLAPESPSGYNYAPLSAAWLGRNSVNEMVCDSGDEPCKEARRNFYRSCRLYEADPEIESAVIEFDGGTELVKVTFTGRFHHCAEAPESIARDIGTWDLEDLTAEPYRTMENGIRQYLRHQALGTNIVATVGDNGANSTVQSLPDNPYASIYPHFLFTKLIPSPREDGNDVQNVSDTRCVHDPFIQMELYLRAMCEGYVDGATTAAWTCDHNTNSLFDFSFQSLCVQAFGNRWISTLPDTVRPDNPEGFGPLPNTEMLAAVFNQFSAAVNLLTRVRVMLPMKLESYMPTATAAQAKSAFNADDSVNNACDAGTAAIWWEGTPADVSVSLSSPTWEEIAPSARVDAFFQGDCDVGGGWLLTTTRTSARIRWSTSDPDAVLAIPESWADMLEDSPALMANVTRAQAVIGRQVVPFAESEGCCLEFEQPCPGFWFHNPDYYVFPASIDSETTCEIMPGTIEAAALGSSTVAFGRAIAGPECLIGPYNTVDVIPITTNGAMIQVPLVP